MLVIIFWTTFKDISSKYETVALGLPLRQGYRTEISELAVHTEYP